MPGYVNQIFVVCSKLSNFLFMEPKRYIMKSGFTLIELSIVIVIIGLIAGAIFVGQDLIDAAAVRAQIAQIDKYQTAVHLFESKYGYLPGDIPASYAAKYSFQPRGLYPGEGDGSGVIEGNCANTATTNSGNQAGCGELAVFWQDLSTAGLIDMNIPTGGNYPNISAPAGWPNTTATTTPAIKDWLPAAKLGQNNYVYVYSLVGANFFGVSTVTKIGWSIDGTATPGMTVQQAYNIDTKIDDGLPQSGNVTACYVNSQAAGGNGARIYAAGGLAAGKSAATIWYQSGGDACIPTTVATGPATTNCFDNNNNPGTQQYSLKSNARIQNCALSFQFQ